YPPVAFPRAHQVRRARALPGVRRSNALSSPCPGQRACPDGRIQPREPRRRVFGIAYPRNLPLPSRHLPGQGDCPFPGSSHLQTMLFGPPPASAPVIVFDLDGTLIDTAPDLVTTLNAIFAREGLPQVDYHSARTMVGGGARMMIERGLKASGRTLPLTETDRL